MRADFGGESDVVSQNVLVRLSQASVEFVEFAERPEPVKM